MWQAHHKENDRRRKVNEAEHHPRRVWRINNETQYSLLNIVGGNTNIMLRLYTQKITFPPYCLRCYGHILCLPANTKKTGHDMCFTEEKCLQICGFVASTKLSQIYLLSTPVVGDDFRFWLSAIGSKANYLYPQTFSPQMWFIPGHFTQHWSSIANKYYMHALKIPLLCFYPQWLPWLW